ncbi:MAG: lipopolysaccharide transport periplasmic protein LptA [Gammaproteobacteria bacterium]|jgi:lipopolysaccharide export system protein LptA
MSTDKHTRTGHRQTAGLALVLLLTGLAPAFAAAPSESAIDITADHFSADKQAGVFIYTGHVRMTRGNLSIAADKATIHMHAGQLQNAVLEGDPATFDQPASSDGPQAHGRARRMEYQASGGKLDLRGQARLEQEGRVIEADVIHYEVDAQRVVAAGESAGGRVHVTLPPEKKTGAEDSDQPRGDDGQ